MNPRRLRYALSITSCVLLLLAQAAPALQEKRGPSTPEERAAALEMIRLIREKPLTREASDAREKVLFWLIQIPDISVIGCSDLVPGATGKENHGSELFVQTTFEQAAFYIENPKRKKDKRAAFRAAVEGTLQMYEAILKEEPEAGIPELDELIKRRDEGKLDDHIKTAVKKCR